MIRQEFINKCHIVDEMKHIDSSLIDKLSFYNEGVSSVSFSYQGVSNVNRVPVDILFKIIQTNKSLKLIKYNMGRKKDNLYRLYSEKKTEDGRGIPQMSRIEINNTRELLAKREGVGGVF